MWGTIGVRGIFNWALGVPKKYTDGVYVESENFRLCRIKIINNVEKPLNV